MKQRCCPSRSAVEHRSFPAEFCRRLSTKAPAVELHSLTLNAAHASQTQPNWGRSYRRRSGCPGPCCGGGFREPSAVPLPRCPLLSGSVRSVRARSLSRPGAAIDWLRHRRRKSLRVPMGVCWPRPLHTIVYIRGARQVPEFWGKTLISAPSTNCLIKFQSKAMFTSRK